MFQLDIQGLDQVTQNLQAVVAQMTAAAPRVLFFEGDRIMGLAAQLVPV